jgi:hypothetical protein
MKIFRFLPIERKNNAWCAAFAAALFLVLFAAAAQCDEIEDSLPPDTPPEIKASARQAIQNGLDPKNVVKLTRSMLQNKFDEQQVQLAHTLMIKAKNSNMPVQPLMNKAFEGMAKNVPPPLIVSAMERVQSRNEFAFQRAARLSRSKSQTANLGRALSDALAAGFSKEDADKITQLLQQRSQSMKSDKAHSLALECYNTARDVSRLGVTSPAVANMLAGALNKGFSHQDMLAMRSAFMTQAQQSQPQNLARSYSAAIQEGKGFQEGPGSGAGNSSEGSGGNAGGGSAGAGGSSGSSGSGSGIGGSGSGGSGSSGSGSGGSGSGGSGGPGPGGGGNQ